MAEGMFRLTLRLYVYDITFFHSFVFLHYVFVLIHYLCFDFFLIKHVGEYQVISLIKAIFNFVHF